MALIKATANQASITQALASAKDGDDIYVSGGTAIMTGAFAAGFTANNARLICDGDVTIRCTLYPLAVATKVCQRIKAMSQLGFSGDFRGLTPANQNLVDSKLPADASDVQALVNTFMATLKPWTDSRMFGAPITRAGSITYNGKSFQWGINWGSGIAKGILNATGTRQVVEGFTWENGRQEGSSYNGTGLYCAGTGLIARRNTFRDCEDGLRASDMLVPNPKGEWYSQYLSRGRQDLFGYVADLFCTYDNCGAGNNAHGRYCGQTLWNLSSYAHVIRSNNGIGLKFHGDGVSVAFAPTVDDTTDSGGITQCVDFDCGPAYLVNGTLTKASAGGGNYQAQVLFRNDREPIPSWSENRCVVIGNIITYLLNHNNIAFVRALNASAFFGDGKGGDMWPGVPVPLTGSVKGNVFRCGTPVGKTQTAVPANFIISGNVLVDLNVTFQDPKISTPNYAFSDASLLDDFYDIIYKAEGSSAPSWLTKLKASPVFPAGFIPTTSAEEDPVQLQQLQDDLNAAEALLVAKDKQITDLTAERDALKAKIATALPLIAQADAALG